LTLRFVRAIALAILATLAAGSVSAAPVFPVRHSANQRYLVDQNGTPFPIMGRTAWFLTSLSVADYQTFVDDTAARGYTAIEFHVINHDPRGNHPPFNGSNNAPFLSTIGGSNWSGSLSSADAPDFTTPNPAYWSVVDSLLAYCDSKGLLVFMFPAYVGAGGGNQGWMYEMERNGSARMQTYGAWIADRYKNQRNLVWMAGGDMGSFTTAQANVESALLTGLASVAGQQSVELTAEWTSDMIATDQTQFGNLMTLNSSYSWYSGTVIQARRAYAHTPTLPAFMLEEPYDEEGPDGNNYNPSATQPVRRFQWWGWLSTTGGYVSGNGYVWPFNSGWKSHLNTQGAQDMARLNAFMSSIAWYYLVPSGLGGMRTLITAGGGFDNQSNYVAAAATPDGSLLLAYTPPAHTGSITVDMAALSGPVRARWFDPTSSAYAGAGTGLANTGQRVFTPPGINSSGQNDWVLVLDLSAPPPPDTTAPSAPGGLVATAVSVSQINLAWTASTDDVGVTGYWVERCQGVGCNTFVQIAAATPTSFSETGLSAGTSYSYRVRATDAAGNLSAYSGVASATPSTTSSGVMAAYSFSEGTGTTVADASSNNTTGTVSGTTWTTAGRYGNALAFNGTSAFVDLGNPATLQLTGSMTVSAWIRSAAFPVDDASIVSKRNGGNSGYQLDTTKDTGPRTIGFKLTHANGSNMARYGATTMQLNQWYYVTGVYDAAAQTLNVYLNGVLDNGTLLGPVSATQQNSSVKVNVGRRSGLSGFAFNGTIDEPRIYTRALTQAEIQADMAAAVGGAP
jgi:chitodextrinase